MAASCGRRVSLDMITSGPSGTGAGSTGAGGSSSSGGSGGSGGSGSVEQCVGVDPGSDAYEAEPGPIIGQGNSGGGGAGGDGGAGGAPATLGPTEIGSDAPVYQLADFQPNSCGYEGVYGLDTFAGTVTVAALLAGW